MTQRVREALSEVPNAEEKKMFRGVVFMVNGKMCITAGDDNYMFRIDPSLHDEVIKKKGVATVVMGGRNYRGYVRVKEDAVKSKKDFDYWIKLALDFNKFAKASPKKKKKS